MLTVKHDSGLQLYPRHLLRHATGDKGVVDLKDHKQNSFHSHIWNTLKKFRYRRRTDGYVAITSDLESWL